MEGTPLLRLFLPRLGFTRYVMQRSLIGINPFFPCVFATPESKIIFRAKVSYHLFYRHGDRSLSGLTARSGRTLFKSDRLLGSQRFCSLIKHQVFHHLRSLILGSQRFCSLIKLIVQHFRNSLIGYFTPMHIEAIKQVPIIQ